MEWTTTGVHNFLSRQDEQALLPYLKSGHEML